MKFKNLLDVLVVISLGGLLACTGNKGSKESTQAPKVWSEEEFKAEGNTDPDHRAEPQKRGEVIVTFDLLHYPVCLCSFFSSLLALNQTHASQR